MTNSDSRAAPPLVTVVICTFNRAELLRGAVLSVAEQRCDVPFEIVVVDNGSTDDTAETLRELSAGSLPAPLRPVVETSRGVSHARNRGVAEARGEWIAFFDDDQVAEPEWLGELLAIAQERDVRCAGGRVRLLLDDEQLRRLPRECRGLLGESAPVDQPRPYDRDMMFGTGNLLVHRDVFAAVGVFDTSLVEGGEDTDLFRRIEAAGFASWYTPTAIVGHTVPRYRTSERYLLWTSRRIGWQLAKREHRQRGRGGLARMLIGRWGQAWLRYWPRRLWGTLRRDPTEALAGRVLVARWRGYRDSALALLAPSWFSGADREAALDFSSERGMFG